MAEATSKLPTSEGIKTASAPAEWRPFESLRREVDRLFQDFQLGTRSPFGRSLFDVEPFWPRRDQLRKVAAVDVVDKDKAYEISAELPGIDEAISTSNSPTAC